MTTTLIVPDQSGVVRRFEDLNAWSQHGTKLFGDLKSNRRALEVNQWEIGDWLVGGENQFGKNAAYSEAQEISGWTRESLYNITWVVKKFPPSLRSEISLGWSHFKELARIGDEKVRETVLQQFSDGLSHSVLDVRARVDMVNSSYRQIGKTSKEKPKDETVSFRIAVDPKLADQIRNRARIAEISPEDWLTRIVTKHLKTTSKTERRTKKI
jgi:hypothetical protein